MPVRYVAVIFPNFEIYSSKILDVLANINFIRMIVPPKFPEDRIENVYRRKKKEAYLDKEVFRKLNWFQRNFPILFH